MLIHASNQHAILFHNPEARRRLARPRYAALVTCLASEKQQATRGCCDAGAAREDVEGETLALQELEAGARDGGDLCDGREGCAFGEVPGYRAVELVKDFVDEGDAG
jgi:hypothetical protein